MFLFELTGRYSGTNQLILAPSEAPRSSAATATVTPISRKKLIWGWRIVIQRAEGGSFILRMFNIAPDATGRADGDGDLAVNAQFHPAGTP